MADPRRSRDEPRSSRAGAGHGRRRLHRRQPDAPPAGTRRHRARGGPAHHRSVAPRRDRRGARAPPARPAGRGSGDGRDRPGQAGGRVSPRRRRRPPDYRTRGRGGTRLFGAGYCQSPHGPAPPPLGASGARWQRAGVRAPRRGTPGAPRRGTCHVPRRSEGSGFAAGAGLCSRRRPPRRRAPLLVRVRVLGRPSPLGPPIDGGGAAR